MTKVFAVVESTDDDGAFAPIIFQTEKNAINHWKKTIKANIGTLDYGYERELTKEEVDEEIDEAIENGYVWTGWDCKVELFTCNLRK